MADAAETPKYPLPILRIPTTKKPADLPRFMSPEEAQAALAEVQGRQDRVSGTGTHSNPIRVPYSEFMDPNFHKNGQYTNQWTTPNDPIPTTSTSDEMFGGIVGQEPPPNMGGPGMFQDQAPDPTAIMRKVEETVLDPSDGASHPPSILDPLRISKEAAGVLQGMDPRSVAGFGAQLTQMMHMMEQQQRLTLGQQLIALAQTFKPYGTGNAAGVAAAFQQQNINRGEQAANNVQRIDARNAAEEARQENIRLKEEDYNRRRWDDLRKKLANEGIDQDIYDNQTYDEGITRLSAIKNENRRRKIKMQDDILRLRQDAESRKNRIVSAIESRHKQSALMKSPRYAILKTQYDDVIRQLNDIDDDIRNVDEKDWFRQQPVWEQRKREAIRQRDEIEAQLLALTPDVEGAPAPTGATGTEAPGGKTRKYSREEARELLKQLRSGNATQ